MLHSDLTLFLEHGSIIENQKRGKIMSNISREQTVIKPDYVGLENVDMIWLSLSVIKFNKINHARKKPATLERINEIANAIKKGNYLPFAYEPPMVEFNEETGMYDLLTGNHRFQGHDLAGETEMWVAVVKFDTDENKEIAQSLENSKKKGKDFGQAFRDEEDIIHTAKNILHKKEKKEEVLESDITKLLEKLGVTKKTELNSMKIEIAKDLKNAPEFVTTITEGQLKSTALDIEENDPSIKTVIKSFGTVHEESRRADKANFDAVMEIKEEFGADTKVKIVTAFHGLDAQQIPFARKSRKNIFSSYEEQVLKQAELINSKNYTTPEFHFLNQIISDNG